MKQEFTIKLPDTIAGEIIQNPDYWQEEIIAFIQERIKEQGLDYRRELVKVITRTKAPVKNWQDLENLIMRGALDELNKSRI